MWGAMSSEVRQESKERFRTVSPVEQRGNRVSPHKSSLAASWDIISTAEVRYRTPFPKRCCTMMLVAEDGYESSDDGEVLMATCQEVIAKID